MKCLQTCSRNLQGGGVSLLANEDEPIFRGYVLPDHPEFLVIFHKLFQLSKLIGLGMSLFIRPYLGSVRHEIIVMIIKQYKYTLN